MYLLITKIIFAISICLLTLTTGLIPLKIARHRLRFLSLSDAFASGIFLSTALLHLLPDAVAKFNHIHTSNYPLAYLICIATCILLVIMERGIFIYSKIRLPDKKTVVPIFLILLLGTHSLVEGAAIGINTNFFEALTIFLAVLAHKGSESFALAMNLHRLALPAKNNQRIITIFSLVTPLGIFIASYIIFVTATNAGGLLSGYFNAIAAGTFLYLGTEHLIENKKSFEQLSEVLGLVFGVAMMALVAIWV